MNYFLIIKTLHVSSVAISLCLFLLRVYWLLHQSQMIKKRAIKILPHVVDSILLFSAFAMLHIINYPSILENHWLAAKTLALILYILTGLYLFKKAKKPNQLYFSLCIALLLYSYIIYVAVSKQVMPFISH